MITIQISEIGHRFNGPWLFRKVSGEFSSGQRIIVTGNNGSGKSTFLNIIAKLLSPREGTVSLQSDQNLNLTNRHQWCGYVNPGVQLYGELTAMEHLQLSRQTRRIEWHAKLEDWKSAALPSDRDWNKPVKSFSSGMKQRLKLLLAVSHSPSLVILDEPFSNLDSAGRKWFEQILVIQQPDTLTFLATNDPADMNLGTTILNINDFKK